MSNTEELQHIMIDEFDAMKLLRYGSFLAMLLAGTAGVLSLFTSTERAPIVLLLVAMFFYIMSAWLTAQSMGVRSNAERARRLLFEVASVTGDVDAHLLSDIRHDRHWLSKNLLSRRRRKDFSYFESSLPLGSDRYVENLQESAFFTFSLARKTRNYLLAFFVLVAALSIGVWLTVSTVDLSNEMRTIARATAAAMTVLLSLPIIQSIISYGQTAHDARDVEGSIADLRRNGTDSSDKRFIELRGLYESIRASADPIPSWIYWCSRKELNEEWAKRNSGSQN